MVEAAWAATRTRSTYLGAQYQRFRRRFGSRGETKAIFAVAHTMLVIAWHVLAAQQPYAELGSTTSPAAPIPRPTPDASPARSRSSASTSPFSRTPPPDPTHFLTATRPWN